MTYAGYPDRFYVTPFILAEIRRLPDHRSLRRFRSFTHERVERFVDEVIDIATLLPDPPSAFVYPHDPDDARNDLAMTPTNKARGQKSKGDRPR